MIDSSKLNQELTRVSFPLDPSKLAELARAAFDANEVWHDPAAARAAGFDQVPVPLTATLLADHWRRGGALEIAEQLGIDVTRLLHGEATWTALAPMRMGERLTAISRLTGIESKQGRRGGSMEIAEIETEVLGEDGRRVVIKRDRLIESGA